MKSGMATVMVIDDSPVVLDWVRDALAKSGHRLITRSSGIGSSADIIRERPDVVLIDVNMPGLPGNVLSQLCKSSASYDVTLLLYSSLPVPELEALAKSCGADGFVQKSNNEA